MGFNYKQLTFAREYRKYKQIDLASNIDGLSQSNLSKFEKGFDTLSNEMVEKIISYLDFPRSFFEEKITINIENAEYRKRTTISVSNKLDIENSIKLIGYIIDKMSNDIEWPDVKLTAYDLNDGFTPQSIANYTRKIFGLKKDEPVRNLISLIESSGIIVYELESHEKFDGVSFQTDNGFPVIVINKFISNDRKRFTLAHELGHLLMHVLCNCPVQEHRNKEDEANIFASELLMPSEEIINSLYDLRLSDLADLKKYWLTSMSAIIRKARDLNCINQDKYTYFYIEMSRKGWKKNEPFDVFLDEAKLFELAYKLFKNELQYSDSELSGIFNIPIDVLNRFCNVSRGKLKIVI